MISTSPLPSIAILAGGLGTRLKSFTQDTPKAMVEVAGEPFIKHQLSRLKKEGLSKVVLCAGHLSTPLVSYLGNGQDFDLEIVYSFDGEELRGTGGALAKALPLLEDMFFVTYGDTYLDINYRSVYEFLIGRPQLSGVMTVLFNENRWGESNCLYESELIKRHSKRSPTAAMKYIDYGLSLLRKSEFRDWVLEQKQTKFELNDYFSFLADQGKLGGFIAEKRFHEIGTPDSLQETAEFLSRGIRNA